MCHAYMHYAWTRCQVPRIRFSRISNPWEQLREFLEQIARLPARPNRPPATKPCPADGVDLTRRLERVRERDADNSSRAVFADSGRPPSRITAALLVGLFR